ncbi:MAG: DMT family transporter [Sporolactobacillus sp.]
MKHRRMIIADCGLLGITLVWGSTFIIVQNTLAMLPPLTFNAWRFLIAAVFLAIWQGFTRSKKVSQNRRNSAGLTRIGVILGIFLFIGYIFQTIGLLYTSAANAAFITGLSVVLVPIFSALLLRKTPPFFAIAGIMLAALGLFLLTTKGSFSLNRGDFIVLFCAIAFALQIVFTEKVTNRFSSLSLTITQLTTVAVLSFLFGAWREGQKMIDWNVLFQPKIIAVLLFMAIVATAAAFLLQTILQKETSATHVGLIYIMEPVFAALTSLIIQHDPLGKVELAGCALILIGMLLSEIPPSFLLRSKQRSR